MKVAFFNTHGFERNFYSNTSLIKFNFFDTQLRSDTAALAQGHEAVCCFVNDTLNAQTIDILSKGGVKLIALRSAGFNHVDLNACAKLGIRVVRVPAYSPHAVAEHALALLLCLNRKIHRRLKARKIERLSVSI